MSPQHVGVQACGSQSLVAQRSPNSDARFGIVFYIPLETFAAPKGVTKINRGIRCSGRSSRAMSAGEARHRCDRAADGHCAADAADGHCAASGVTTPRSRVRSTFRRAGRNSISDVSELRLHIVLSGCLYSQSIVVGGCPRRRCAPVTIFLTTVEQFSSRVQLQQPVLGSVIVASMGVTTLYAASRAPDNAQLRSLSGASGCVHAALVQAGCY